MSENTTGDEGVIDEGTGEGEGDTGAPPSNREARYRIRARDAEAARDAAVARVNALTTREALRAAAAHLAQPADLFEIGKVDIATLLNDDGDIDADAVASACASLVESRPLLARPKAKATDWEGGARFTHNTRTRTMQDLLRDAVAGKR